MNKKIKGMHRNRFASYGLGIAAGIALLVNNLGAQSVNTNPGNNITPNVTFSYSSLFGEIGIDLSTTTSVGYFNTNNTPAFVGSGSSATATNFNLTGDVFYYLFGEFQNGATAGSNNYILLQDPVTSDYYYDQFTLSTTNAILDDVVDFGANSNATASQAYTAIQSAPEPSTYALLGLGVLTLFIAYRRRVA
jgi:hypothetical protein